MREVLDCATPASLKEHHIELDFGVIAGNLSLGGAKTAVPKIFCKEPNAARLIQLEMMATCWSCRGKSGCRWQAEFHAITCDLINYDAGESLPGLEETIQVSKQPIKRIKLCKTSRKR